MSNSSKYSTRPARRASVLFAGLLTTLAWCTSSVAQTFPPQFTNALQRGEYSVFAGDVNGDGYTDVLAKARLKLVMVDLDGLVPIAIKPASPTFVLLSQSGTSYALSINPGASILNSSVWQPNSHDIVFGDVIGTGSVSMLLRARVPGQPSFLISTSAANGSPVLLQELSTAQIGYDLSASGTTVSLSDSNRDGRADLVIRSGGLIQMVLTANAQGMFAKPANDSDAIMVAWRSFCAALDSGDTSSAARFITEQGQTIYVPALQSLGSGVSGLTTNWSEPKAVRVSGNFAVYGLRQTFGGTTSLHLIRFMREDNRWLLDEF